jgi:hypothetical protein
MFLIIVNWIHIFVSLVLSKHLIFSKIPPNYTLEHQWEAGFKSIIQNQQKRFDDLDVSVNLDIFLYFLQGCGCD